MSDMPLEEEVNFLTAAPEIDEKPKGRKAKAADASSPAVVKVGAAGIPQADPKKLQALQDSIVKKYGQEALTATSGQIAPVTVIPTGSIGLDLALGVGGIPLGRITEIYGPESSGKTTLCQHIIASAQKLGGACAFVDMEHALDPAYATRCGVNIPALTWAQPTTGEEALGMVEDMIASGNFAVVVVDSVATLVPKSELDGEMGEAPMGKQARLMGQALRKLSPRLSQQRCALVFTNQLRQKIGVMFGNPETTTGGMALKFYASVRLDVRRIQSLKGDGGEITGTRARVRVVKNKVAPPMRETEFDIMFNGGIDKMSDLLDVASNLEVITKRGAFFSYNDDRIGQGRENAKHWLLDHPAVADEIYAKVMVEARRKADEGVVVSQAAAEDSEA